MNRPPGTARRLLDIDAATYTPHPLHRQDRIWSETNCYVDLWIEVLHALGQDPIAGCGYALSADFDGAQWTFFKPPAEDLRNVYGLDVAEMNVWRPVLDHVEEQLDLGRLLTVEADAFYLPDTAGVSYRTEHTKTTIVPQMVDRSRSVLGYFHGPGYFELDPADLAELWPSSALPPYTELIRLDGLRRPAAAGGPDPDLVGAAVACARQHLRRRPTTNPVRRLAARLAADIPWLTSQPDSAFHLLAFGTCRQCGASCEVAASHVDWLDRHDGGGLRPAVERLLVVAEGAKALQFSLARAARGRSVDLEALVSPMADAWDEAMALLGQRYDA